MIIFTGAPAPGAPVVPIPLQILRTHNVQTLISHTRAVATSTVGSVSTGPLFEAITTFLPMFSNSAACQADRYKATWP